MVMQIVVHLWCCGDWIGIVHKTRVWATLPCEAEHGATQTYWTSPAAEIDVPLFNILWHTDTAHPSSNKSLLKHTRHRFLKHTKEKLPGKAQQQSRLAMLSFFSLSLLESGETYDLPVNSSCEEHQQLPPESMSSHFKETLQLNFGEACTLKKRFLAKIAP